MSEKVRINFLDAIPSNMEAVIQNHTYNFLILETRSTQELRYSKLRWIYSRKEWKLRARQILLQDHQKMFCEGRR